MSNEIINPFVVWRDSLGNPLANGTLTFNVNETSTPTTVYSDEALTIAQSNPYTLDAAGRSIGDIRFTGKIRVVVKDSTGATVRTLDNVVSASGSSSDLDSYAKIYDTVALLKAATNTEAGLIYKVIEHTSGYGYRGSSYFLSRALTAASDDNGGLIKSTGVPTIEFVNLFPDGKYRPEQWGAKMDGYQGTGSISSSDQTFTADSAIFTSADVGKGIAVFNAGASTASLLTTIASYTNSTTVELSASAGTTVSSAVFQMGTDNSTAMQACIDYPDTNSLTGGEIEVKGPSYHGTAIQFRADKVHYNCVGSRWFGNNTSVVDTRTATRLIQDITGDGGSFEPIGDTVSSGSVNYNAWVAVAAHNVKWSNITAVCRQGTRGVGIQTDDSWGVTPYQNLNNIQLPNVKVIGDGTTNDGLDITSSNGDGMIQNVYVQGHFEGCDRGVNHASGTGGQQHENINLDLVIVDPATIGAKVDRCENSAIKIKIIGATTDGFTTTGPINTQLDLDINGTGASLATAAAFVDASDDTVNKAKIKISYDGTNAWTTGILPTLNDCIYDVDIDGATLCFDNGAGFRSIFRHTIVRNYTTLADTLIGAHDVWGPVINWGAGANPIPLFQTMPCADGTNEIYGLDAAGGKTITIADMATAQPFGAVTTFSGMLLITGTAGIGDTALFTLGNGVAFLGSGDSSVWSVTASTASHVNVYYSSSIPTIENLSGGQITIRIMPFRTRNA